MLCMSAFCSRGIRSVDARSVSEHATDAAFCMTALHRFCSPWLSVCSTIVACPRTIKSRYTEPAERSKRFCCDALVHTNADTRLTKPRTFPPTFFRNVRIGPSSSSHRRDSCFSLVLGFTIVNHPWWSQICRIMGYKTPTSANEVNALLATASVSSRSTADHGGENAPMRGAVSVVIRRHMVISPEQDQSALQSPTSIISGDRTCHGARALSTKFSTAVHPDTAVLNLVLLISTPEPCIRIPSSVHFKT
eukprot:SAG31_NODE_13390_length_873_cov_0.824289_2_plen_249_part_01